MLYQPAASVTAVAALVPLSVTVTAAIGAPLTPCLMVPCTVDDLLASGVPDTGYSLGENVITPSRTSVPVPADGSKPASCALMVCKPAARPASW